MNENATKPATYSPCGIALLSPSLWINKLRKTRNLPTQTTAKAQRTFLHLSEPPKWNEEHFMPCSCGDLYGNVLKGGREWIKLVTLRKMPVTIWQRSGTRYSTYLKTTEMFHFKYVYLFRQKYK